MKVEKLLDWHCAATAALRTRDDRDRLPVDSHGDVRPLGYLLEDGSGVVPEISRGDCRHVRNRSTVRTLAS